MSVYLCVYAPVCMYITETNFGCHSLLTLYLASLRQSLSQAWSLLSSRSCPIRAQGSAYLYLPNFVITGIPIKLVSSVALHIKIRSSCWYNKHFIDSIVMQAPKISFHFALFYSTSITWSTGFGILFLTLFINI